MNQTAELIALSGLTAGQVARTVGCSGRTLTGYGAGAVPSPEYQARLERLTEVIIPLGDTPEVRRRALLNSSNGPSVFHRLITEVPRGQVLQSTIPVRDRLGI